MIAVIIAGGSGTRLWPLSTPKYPKHLLKVNGGSRSMLQSTYDRTKNITNTVYVMTEASHATHVREQIEELPKEHFIVEPGRRGTAHCIVSALAILKPLIAGDEPICFMSADHYIRDQSGFERSFKIAAEASKNNKAITLVGIDPDNPAVGFGYIKKGKLVDDTNLVFSVGSFKEKPDYDTAKKYLRSGEYLWNTGYFVGSINCFEEALEKYSPNLFLDYQKLVNAKNQDDFEQIYLNFDTKVIDYELIEKVPNLLVVPASFDWMDLGSYTDLHRAVESDDEGNHIQGEVYIDSVENSFIQNHEDKPVAVVGLDNIVVINSPDGILVARKDLSKSIGNAGKRASR